MTDAVHGLNVSRETNERLHILADLLKKWNPKINLVAQSTLQSLWSRHIVDSAQLYDLAPKHCDHWADLGSGGGFPGMVVAILAQDAPTPPRMTLVESDARKSTFLRTVMRETGVDCTVITARIEDAEPLGAGIVSARALARLPKLLGFVHRHLAEYGTALLPKGEQWQKEVREAESKWHFTYRPDRSVVQKNSVILRITGLDRV